MNSAIGKGAALLAFLKATATIRRKRIGSYGTGDRLLWFADVPRERAECRSPFLTHKPEELSGLWLEVRKKRMPARPPVPQVVADWVRTDDLDQPEKEPELLPEITLLVEQRVPDPDAPHDIQRTIVATVPELRRLVDHREVEDAWLVYLVERWEPWAQEMRRWQDVQTVYESLDFMRRRLEEAEERYELLLAIGLLQWRDPTGTAVERHVLTAPAELTLDAARGLLTAVPAASFDRFRVELDMLELQHRPRLNEDTLGEQLEALDIQAWDTAPVASLLREIANSLRADAQVDETFQRADRTEERPRLSFAPALVLRERRPTAYEDLIRRFFEAATADELDATQPWRRLLWEGESPSGCAGDPVAALGDDIPGRGELDRFLFPLPTNEEQRQIVQSLQAQPCVLVKGPPGTGKSHTIANLICHLLARGDRVLVTAHAPKALAVLRGLLPDDIRDLSVTARRNDGIERPREQWFRRASPRDPDRGGAPKSRTFHGRDWLERARQRWADATNRTLERCGRAERVDHRSYERQGLDRQPGEHYGPAAAHLVGCGHEHDRIEVAGQVADGDRALDDLDHRIAMLEATKLAILQDGLPEEREPGRRDYGSSYGGGTRSDGESWER